MVTTTLRFGSSCCRYLKTQPRFSLIKLTLLIFFPLKLLCLVLGEWVSAKARPQTLVTEMDWLSNGSVFKWELHG